MGDHRGNSADDGRDNPADDGAGDGADHRGDDAAHSRGGDNTVGVGGDNRSVDSGGVDKRISLSFGLGLGLTLAIVVTVDRVKSREDTSVDSRVDGGGSVVDGRVDSRGGNVVDGRGGSVDSTVANGTNTRDKAVAVVDSGDDSTGGQTMGNLPNGVSLGISLSLGGSHKQNKSEGPHDLSRLVL